MFALGTRIKTGFAIAILVERTGEGFVAGRRECVPLSSPDLPDSQFPYHPALEFPGDTGAVSTKRAVDAVRRTARKEMAALLKGLPPLCCAGLAVGSLMEPDEIANAHVRAHALEGKLFREVVADALTRRGIAHRVLVESAAYETVAGELSCDPQRLRQAIDRIGKDVITPWRVDERLAVLAAYWQLNQVARARATG